MRARLTLCTAVALVAVPVALVVGGSVTRLAVAAPGEDQTPIATPTCRSCGIDILVILDESGSIENAGATDDVQDAFRAFTSRAQQHRLAAWRCRSSPPSRDCRCPAPRSAATPRSPTRRSDTSSSPTSAPATTRRRHALGGRLPGRPLLPARPSPDPAHLVVFITDGDPNEIVRNDRVTYDPGNPNEAAERIRAQGAARRQRATRRRRKPAKNRAVPNANALKAKGSHILAVAVGNG